MIRVHRITLQALEPSVDAACAQLARHLPDAVFGPLEGDVVELLIPAPSVERAMDRAWAAIAAEGDAELFAVVGGPRY